MTHNNGRVYSRLHPRNMPDETKPNLSLEIAHVLFIDVVGYSKLLIDEQAEVVSTLNSVVRECQAVQETEAARQLIRLPTGDGMALVFTKSAEEPVQCALQISQTLRAESSLPVRMGIHSGPVHQLKDVNERANITGRGINIAQRIMDCGDAGHILRSKHVADDLERPLPSGWRPRLIYGKTSHPERRRRMFPKARHVWSKNHSKNIVNAF